MNLITGNKYKWKHGTEALIYTGAIQDGFKITWHQFAKEETPENTWCEVRDQDLNLLVEWAPKLTKQQAIIISAYTGITCCKFSDMHEDVEKRLGRPVYTHEFGGLTMKDHLRNVYREDFLAICYRGD